jgi:hypothetical protein
LGGEYVLIVLLYNYVNSGRIYGEFSKQPSSLVFYSLSKGEKRVLFMSLPLDELVINALLSASFFCFSKMV